MPLTAQQIEGKRTMQVIYEAEEASELVKEKLKGLRYDSVTHEEKNTGWAHMTEMRMEQVMARAKSIQYLLRSSRFFTPNDLQEAKYFTVADLIERKSEAISLLLNAMNEIQNPCSPQISLQTLSDKFRIQTDDFSVDEKTGQIVLREISAEKMKEIQTKLEKTIQFASFCRERYEKVLLDSRTGIDPGVLSVAPDKKSISYQVEGSAGLYHIPKSFLSAPLDITGLIVLPNSGHPFVLHHEYAHFEDYMFYGGQRKKLENLIGEINSMLLAIPDTPMDYLKNRTDSVFENMKGTLLNYYLKKEKPARLSMKDGRGIICVAVDTIKRLVQLGFPRNVVSSILLHAKEFEDILHWNRVNDDAVKKLIK